MRFAIFLTAVLQHFAHLNRDSRELELAAAVAWLVLWCCAGRR